MRCEIDQRKMCYKFFNQPRPYIRFTLQVRVKISSGGFRAEITHSTRVEKSNSSGHFASEISTQEIQSLYVTESMKCAKSFSLVFASFPESRLSRETRSLESGRR